MRETVLARGFDWDDLRYFLAVARAGTVSEAARRLGADHATVIRRIDGLERALGAKIVERNPRGYNLTHRGELLLASAQRIEDEAARAEHAFGGAESRLSGLVRISTLEGFGNYFLASRIPQFMAANEGLNVELLLIQQIVALSRRESDLAVTLHPPENANFRKEKLVDYSLFVYASESYLRTAPKIRDPADIAGHRFAGYIEDLIFVRGLSYLDELHRGLQTRLQSSSLQAQMEAVSAGYGLCVLPAFVARSRRELIPILPDRLRLSRSYWLVSGADTTGTPRLRAAWRFVKDQVAASKALFMPTGDTI